MPNITVAFVTLFLSLITGPQMVEVSVTGPVARVEIRIDGETVGVINGEPWKAECDFGGLRPFVLEAVAFDGEGNESARARQLVNLPRPAVESFFVLERGADGQPVSARLISKSALGLTPTSIELTLDGEPIEASDPSTIPLPPTDPEAVHFLSARIDFGDFLVSNAVVSFGGLYGSETTTELTAVPVLRTKAKRRLKAADLEGFFVVRGHAPEIVAVEKSMPSLLIVADRGAYPVLLKIQKRRLRVGPPYTDLPPARNPDRESPATLRRLRNLEEATGKVWMVSTFPRESSADGHMLDVFSMTPAFSLFRDGVMWLLCHPRILGRSSADQQLCDAVAVAGLYAAHTATARAVLLVLGSRPDEWSLYRPAQVRSYLRALNVPLFVWATMPGPHVEAWGESDQVTSAGEFNRAITAVQELLKHQTIVWLGGAYLPNEIELSPEVDDLQLAR
jgi:hypothetical protein